MLAEEIEDIIRRYKSRPNTRTGASLERHRAEILQGIASAKLEGYAPIKYDLDAMDLLAEGRISRNEFTSLCLMISRFKTAALSSE